MTEIERAEAAKRFTRASARVQWWRDRILPRTVSARQRAFVLNRIAHWQTSRAEAAQDLGGELLADRRWCADVARLIAATDRALLRGEIWQVPEVGVTEVAGVPRLLGLLAIEPDVLRRAELVQRLGMALGPDSRAGDLAAPMAARFALQLAMSLYRAAGLSRDEAWRLTFDIRDQM